MGAISECKPQSAYVVKRTYTGYIPPNDFDFLFDATHSRRIGDGDTPAKRLGISEEEYNSTETPAEAIGISKEDYFEFFSLTYDGKGKTLFFPPADTPIDVQRAWYDTVSSMDIISRGLLLSDICLALTHGDYYTNTTPDLATCKANMMDRIKNLGGVGCLQLAFNAMSHQLSDMAYNGATEERYRLLEQSLTDSVGRVLDRAKENLSETQRRQIKLANKDFLLHMAVNAMSHQLSDMGYNGSTEEWYRLCEQSLADAVDRILDRAKENLDETTRRQIELANKDFLLHKH